MNRLTEDKVNTLTAAMVFLFTLAVYTVTMTPTVPFWDSGEYIATSYILGIPHAPGTPLYVLLGKMFTLIPIGTIAQRVNWFSALASSITLLFTYLITVKVSRRLFPREEYSGNRVLAYVAGVVGALMAGFATTFWDNAIEAEVYAAACAIMTFAVWLVMRWQERLGEGTEDGLLLLITYIVGLGVGIHLGVAIAAWAAVVFVFICRPHYLKRWNYIGWAITTLALGVGINAMTFLWAPLVLMVTLGIYLFTGKLRKLALWSSMLFIVGVSVHFFLIIRSNLDPAINEAAPKDWESLWLMLIRDQYKPGSPFERRADLWYQIDHMYLRYMWWNFTLMTDRLREFSDMATRAIAAKALLPVMLCIAGAVMHFLKDKKTFAILGTLFLFLGPAMVFYLNFREGEVRERDYFFVQNFQFMAIWVGIGAAWFVDTLRRVFRGASAQRIVMAGASLVFVVMALLPLYHNFHRHDRRGFFVAQNYAYNMLVALEPNSIIFTNGDNDTFPLWYLQEVEGVRKDVRVVNLSLLNTGWYIRQLRDLEPKVPVTWSEDQINLLVPYRDRAGKVWMVKDQAVAHILAANKWERPVYLAVTVPDQMGLQNQLVMEGLVFRVNPEPTDMRMDVEKTRRNLHEVYKYDGLVVRSQDPDAASFGTYDTEVYKDDNSSKLVQNYSAAFSRLAIELYELGRPEEALQEMTNAEAISPNFPGVAVAKGYLLEELNRLPEAEEHYRRFIEIYPGEWQLSYRLAAVLTRLERYRDAIPFFERAIQIQPTRFDAYQGLLSIYYNLGDYQRALEVLQRWLQINPGDENVRGLYDQLLQSVREGRGPAGEGGDSTGGGGGGR